MCDGGTDGHEDLRILPRILLISTCQGDWVWHPNRGTTDPRSVWHNYRGVSLSVMLYADGHAKAYKFPPSMADWGILPYAECQFLVVVNPGQARPLGTWKLISARLGTAIPETLAEGRTQRSRLITDGVLARSPRRCR